MPAPRRALLIALVCLGGCGQIDASVRLHDARRDYARAEAGPAFAFAQPELATARQRLGNAAQLVATHAGAQRERDAIAAAENAITTARVVGEQRAHVAREQLVIDRTQLAELRPHPATTTQGLAPPLPIERVRGSTPAAATPHVAYLGVVLFDTGRAIIPEDQRAIVRRAADALTVLPAGTRVLVTGYADPTGSASLNVALSQARAEAVRDALLSYGVAGSRVATSALGPFAGPRQGTASWELERRVEITAILP